MKTISWGFAPMAQWFSADNLYSKTSTGSGVSLDLTEVAIMTTSRVKTRLTTRLSRTNWALHSHESSKAVRWHPPERVGVMSQFWESARPRRRIQKSTIQDARQEIKRSCGGAQGQRSFALGRQGEEEARHPPRQLFQVHLQGVRAFP